MPLRLNGMAAGFRPGRDAAITGRLILSTSSAIWAVMKTADASVLHFIQTVVSSAARRRERRFAQQTRLKRRVLNGNQRAASTPWFYALPDGKPVPTSPGSASGRFPIHSRAALHMFVFCASLRSQSIPMVPDLF
jgi:hypothetical protein